MDAFIQDIKTKGFLGDIDSSLKTRDLFSHDASLFELMPQLVVAPKNSADLEILVKSVAAHKKTIPDISLTARSAGTCMSGGAVSESVIVDFKKYFTSIENVSSTKSQVQPGVFYRDFEIETLKHEALMPSYPASRELCTVGGMVNNNAGGEKSLQYGKTEKFVTELQVVLSDGNSYRIKPLTKSQLDAKIAQNDFEGELYAKVFDIVDKNYDQIKNAQPKVSKDSTGYHLWNVWDRGTGIFDLTQAIVGAQGTLCLVTDIHFRLVPAPKHSGTLVVFLRRLDNLGDVINKVLTHKPATFEGFDNYTLMLSFKLFYFFHQSLGWGGMIKLAFQLIPDAFMLFRGIPKMVLLIEFNGQTTEEVAQKVHAMRLDMKEFGHESLFEEDETEAKAKKFWIMRRESFNLLRKKVHDKHTAPFIDDLVVLPEYLPKFLPELRSIVDKYKLLAPVAGHMGDGNFHVIPLMEIEKESEIAKIQPAMKEVNELVLKYGGSISGEHNDGMIRGPWLEKMYGKEVLDLFKQLKHDFDPLNIFNPHKKTDASWDYTMAHIRHHF
ncbi:MAG: FAD-binding oxidoreductase [Candidatus Saccharibacteria bacterium]